MWNSNLFVSCTGSSLAVSGQHVAGGESGGGAGSESSGGGDALESPGLGGWCLNGVGWEGWVVGVGGLGWGSASLNAELGSILHESLGGTTAELFGISTVWSLGGGITGILWIVAKGTDTGSWEGGEVSVG